MSLASRHREDTRAVIVCFSKAVSVRRTKMENEDASGFFSWPYILGLQKTMSEHINDDNFSYDTLTDISTPPSAPKFKDTKFLFGNGTHPACGNFERRHENSPATVVKQGLGLQPNHITSPDLVFQPSPYQPWMNFSPSPTVQQSPPNYSSYPQPYLQQISYAFQNVNNYAITDDVNHTSSSIYHTLQSTDPPAPLTQEFAPALAPPPQVPVCSEAIFSPQHEKDGSTMNSNSLSKDNTWPNVRPGKQAPLVKCPRCDYVSKRTYNMERHFREMHLPRDNRKKMKCCGNVFTTKSEFREHHNKIHAVFGYLCTYPNCAKMFERRATLLRHHTIHRNGDFFFCSVCGYGTPYKFNLQRHMREKHNLALVMAEVSLRSDEKRKETINSEENELDLLSVPAPNEDASVGMQNMNVTVEETLSIQHKKKINPDFEQQYKHKKFKKALTK